MRAYLELVKIDLRLALRDKSVLFFSYLFPLIFFFTFAELFDARKGGAIAHVVSMVLLMGILGNGLFGAGMRTVHDRENHILRRFKVAPITSTPLLVASLVTGWVLYVPAVLIILALASSIYGMTVPGRPISFLVILTFGLLAFRSLGLILAAVANSMQEVNILVQVIYTPMLFLSGALFPITLLPAWVQLVSQYLPATYLVSGLQGVLLKNETLMQHAVPVVALFITIVLGTFISAKLFRWEKEEKVPARAKGWVLAALAPFLLLGTLQFFSQDQIVRARILYREIQRKENLLIQDARIFVGNGEILERGSVLIEDGVIKQLIKGADTVISPNATVVSASGKTLLPGLIDTFSLPGETGGIEANPADSPRRRLERALAAQLYCGVTAVRGVDLPLEVQNEVKAGILEGSILGAEVFTAAPAGARGGFSEGSSFMGSSGSTPQEADAQIFQIPALPRKPYLGMMQVLASRGRKTGTPLIGILESADGLRAALQIGLTQVVYPFPEGQFDPAAVSQAVAEDVLISVSATWPEAVLAVARRDPSLLERSLVQQVATAETIDELTRKVEAGTLMADAPSPDRAEQAYENARRALVEAYRSGVTLIPGSQAGRSLLFQGPSLHHELQIWANAGIPAPDVLQSATSIAAAALGAGNRIGQIKPGYEATLLLVDGDPTTDIGALERISTVIFKGERINRAELLNPK